MPQPSRFALGLTLLILTPMTGHASWRGYIERPYTPTACIQESHFLIDPCTGATTLLKESATLDLDPFVCTGVVVDGPNIGIECQVIQPSSVAPSSPTCPDKFGLWLDDLTSQVDWYRVPCATGYDVIRGLRSAVSAGGSIVDLGPVTCLANDVPQVNVWSVTGPADGGTPAVGEVFFYLVRSRSVALGDETYGESSSQLERLPSSGDCSF